MSATGEDFAAVEKGRTASSSSLDGNDDDNDNDNIEEATSGRRGSRGREEKQKETITPAGDHDDQQVAMVVAVVGDGQQVTAAVTSGRDGETFAPSEILVDSSSSSSSDHGNEYEDEDEGEEAEVAEVVAADGSDHENNIAGDEEVEEIVAVVAAVEVLEGGGGNEQEVTEAVAAVAANAAVGIAAPTGNEVGEVTAAAAAPNNGGDEQIVMAMEVESAVVVAAPGNEEGAIGEGVEAVYIALLGRGRKDNRKKQKYQNGTSITMFFDQSNDIWWGCEFDERMDGVVVGYDCFNLCDRDMDMGICQQWKYMVRFPMRDGSSFLELVPEDELVDHLSENSEYYLVKKHWGKLIEEQDGDDNVDVDDDDDDDDENRTRILRGCKRFIADTTGAYAVDWDVFLTDLNRVPKLATFNILSEEDYFGLSYDEYREACMNVLFLAIITECPNNVIEKLLELGPEAIENHSISHWQDKGFYEEWMLANPDGFLNIDPEILRVLLQHTKNNEEAICFGEEDEFGLAPIRRFLQQHQVSISPDNVVIISPHVKVILEENYYALSKLLAQEFMSKNSVLSSIEDGGGVRSLVCKEVIRFALECAGRNVDRCFNSKIHYLYDYDYLYKSLLEIMLEYLGDEVDNRDLFHRYMRVYLSESNNDSISLVNCVLDSLPKQNNIYLWKKFWDIFEGDEWGGEDATATPRHPLFTAIRLECQYDIILDIVTKDPSILESLDNYESLPPFAIVAATRSYKHYIHPKKGYCCSYKRRTNSKPRQAIICGTCTDINPESNDLDSTYELLRMNPAVIGNILSPPPQTPTASGNGKKKKNRKRSSINARNVDDGTTATQPFLRPSTKRVKKSSDNKNDNLQMRLGKTSSVNKNKNNLRTRLASRGQSRAVVVREFNAYE
jgi:hypothetical protein